MQMSHKMYDRLPDVVNWVDLEDNVLTQVGFLTITKVLLKIEKVQRKLLIE
jgi:hypothetical protein